MSTRRVVLALYGSVVLERGYCRACRTNAFIRHGKLACCGASIEDDPTRYQRIVSPDPTRRRPKKADQERILEEQGHACIYCGIMLGQTVIKNRRLIKIRINWDHQVPWAYAQNNQAENFVAACHVCNSLKADYVYRDLEDARLHLAQRRAQKGCAW